METTVAERRAHRGLETPRQWSDPAIERTTSRLFGLCSVTAQLTHAMSPNGNLPVQTTARDVTSHTTFAEVPADTRHH
jgi:hypothetical protein